MRNQKQYRAFLFDIFFFFFWMLNLFESKNHFTKNAALLVKNYYKGKTKIIVFLSSSMICKPQLQILVKPTIPGTSKRVDTVSNQLINETTKVSLVTWWFTVFPTIPLSPQRVYRSLKSIPKDKQIGAAPGRVNQGGHDVTPDCSVSWPHQLAD